MGTVTDVNNDVIRTRLSFSTKLIAVTFRTIVTSEKRPMLICIVFWKTSENRSAWDDTFVDALCEPAETFTFGGVFAHIMTFNAHRRLMALDALRQLGVQTEGFRNPMECEESVALGTGR